MLFSPARVWRLYRMWQVMNPSVFSAGNVLTAGALNDATQGPITTYTPAVANDGTATYTTRTGWYYKFGAGHLVYMNAYLVINAAGSGVTDITVTAPTNIERTTRQVVPCDLQDGTSYRVGFARANTSGSGAVFDKVDLVNKNVATVGTDNHSTITGSGLAAGSILAFAGFYRMQ